VLDVAFSNKDSKLSDKPDPCINVSVASSAAWWAVKVCDKILLTAVVVGIDKSRYIRSCSAVAILAVLAGTFWLLLVVVVVVVVLSSVLGRNLACDENANIHVIRI